MLYIVGKKIQKFSRFILGHLKTNEVGQHGLTRLESDMNVAYIPIGLLPFASFSDRMTKKKGMIIPNDLESLRSRYRISDCIELLAPTEGETLRDHYEGNIYLNEWMFKAEVHIRFDFGISKLLHIFGAAPIQEEPEGCPYGEASGFLSSTRSFTEGSPALILHRPGHRARLEERLKKGKCLVKGLGQTPLITLLT
ncbi:hypothetical protein ACLOJK_029251 [Asimina triloba]